MKNLFKALIGLSLGDDARTDVQDYFAGCNSCTNVGEVHFDCYKHGHYYSNSLVQERANGIFKNRLYKNCSICRFFSNIGVYLFERNVSKLG